MYNNCAYNGWQVCGVVYDSNGQTILDFVWILGMTTNNKEEVFVVLQ
jgi:hypothetical protein